MGCDSPTIRFNGTIQGGVVGAGNLALTMANTPKEEQPTFQFEGAAPKLHPAVRVGAGVGVCFKDDKKGVPDNLDVFVVSSVTSGRYFIEDNFVGDEVNTLRKTEFPMAPGVEVRLTDSDLVKGIDLGLYGGYEFRNASFGSPSGEVQVTPRNTYIFEDEGPMESPFIHAIRGGLVVGPLMVGATHSMWVASPAMGRLIRSDERKYLEEGPLENGASFRLGEDDEQRSIPGIIERAGHGVQPEFQLDLIAAGRLIFGKPGKGKTSSN